MDKAKRNRLRRIHVQSHRRDFGGFCPWCAVVLKQSNLRGHIDGCPDRPQGKKRRMLIVDWEEQRMRFTTINGVVIETTPQGWRQMHVAGEEHYVKRLNGEGGLAVITRWEALRCGVEGVPGARPVVTTYRSATSTTVSRKPAPPTPKSLDLSQYEVGTVLSREAKRLAKGLSDPEGRKEALRKKHIKKHIATTTKSNR